MVTVKAVEASIREALVSGSRRNDLRVICGWRAWQQLGFTPGMPHDINLVLAECDPDASPDFCKVIDVSNSNDVQLRWWTSR